VASKEPTEWTFAALERTTERFAGWVQFADAKAAGVLVLLGLGLADLLDHAGRLSHAHRLTSAWGTLASVALWAALALALVTVVETSRALFPRIAPVRKSAFFFGSVAEYKSGAEYASALTELSLPQATEQLAEQAWELSRIASRKFARLRLSYWFVLAFLAAWALARTALALAG
jgi:hypothetical protein